MDPQLSALFVSRWRTYFGDAGLPICFFYTDQPRADDVSQTINEHRCLIGNLDRVRAGYSYVYGAGTPGCSGGKRYTGYAQALGPKFAYFLSCGIPGELEGERYKKSPELVRQGLEKSPPLFAPGKYLVFKRWDKLAEGEEPLAVIFFATPDVLSGLYTLANFDVADPHGVTAPMGAGCSSIVYHPYREASSADPRCILGMFDVSARPRLPAQEMTFTAPMRRFEQMVRNMDESFLITESWKLVQARL
jgi:hypothetical protein